MGKSAEVHGADGGMSWATGFYVWRPDAQCLWLARRAGRLLGDCARSNIVCRDRCE